MKKKNILTIALSLSMAGVIAVGATLAYFTDSTDAKTNTFTMGKVKINLEDSTTEDETEATSGKDGIQFHNVMPGDTRNKKVEITKADGSADCYVAILVEAVPDADANVPACDDLLDCVKKSVTDSTAWTVKYLDSDRNVTSAADENKNKIPDDARYALYVYNDALVNETDAATLFTTITFPGEEWDNDYAEASFSLKVTGYAVQKDNFLLGEDNVAPTPDKVATWFADNLADIEDDDLDNVVNADTTTGDEGANDGTVVTD